MRYLLTFIFLLFIVNASLANNHLWRGLKVEPENRCTPYDKKKQYPYPQSVEDKIVESYGGHVYGPYTGRYFLTDTQTDIEHIVATSEGHESGLCSASKEKRKAFATDLLNLTLAHKDINRCGAGGKCNYDAAEWLPPMNKCWFANRIVQIKTKYELSVDKLEAEALDDVLNYCTSFDIVFTPITSLLRPQSTEGNNALSQYDDNNNGRITCSEARKHGITPVKSDHPAYPFMRDTDGDGTVCE